MKWLVKKSVFRIRQKVMVRIDTQITKNDVRRVKYSSNGMDFGVLVVAIC
jgi:hypothetical protein